MVEANGEVEWEGFVHLSSPSAPFCALASIAVLLVLDYPRNPRKLAEEKDETLSSSLLSFSFPLDHSR